MIFFPTCFGWTNEISFQNIGFSKHLDCMCSSKISVSFCRFSLSWSLTCFDLCSIACIPGCWQNDPWQQVWYEWQEGRLKGEGRGSKYIDTPSCPCLFVKKIYIYKNIYKICSFVYDDISQVLGHFTTQTNFHWEPISFWMM